MIEDGPEIKIIILKCKDCGIDWPRKYRKEFRDSTNSFWWRPSIHNHYCEVLKKKSESDTPPEEGIT